MEKANKKLQALTELWHEKREGKAMPSRADLSVTVLRPWLGNLALIDLTGAAAYFRLCGTGLHERFGGEMTRKTLDLLDEPHGGRALRDCIEAARQTRAPARMTHTQPRGGRNIVFHELCAPLAHDGETIDTVLFASYAEQAQ